MQVDGISGGAEVKTLRRELVEMGNTLSARVGVVHKQSQAQGKAYAEARKEDGNQKVGEQKYKEAEEFYAEAIRLDRTNAVYYCNRASCRMELKNWVAAAEDATEALKCDVNYSKAYVLAGKCYMELKQPTEAANAILSGPIAVRAHPEVKEVITAVAPEIKTLGNAKLKEGKLDEAIAFYTQGGLLQPKNPVFFSNRSAAYQSKKHWRDALNSAKECIKADKTFVKGYLHLAKSLLQLNSPLEARHNLEEGLAVLKSEGKEENQTMKDMLKELLDKEGTQPGGSSANLPSAGVARATVLKDQGNEAYKMGKYPGALKLYTAAISADKANGALYGNRAACWMMLKEYQRAVDDCTAGLKYENAGELGKLRTRMATALTHQNKTERAIDILNEGVAKGGEYAAALEKQMTTLKAMLTQVKVAEGAMESKDYKKAKLAYAKVVATPGMEHNAAARLGAAKANMALEEYGEANSEAQKALASDPNSQEAYLIRGDCLHYLGETTKALQHLTAALQRDPDNNTIAKRLKALKAISRETERIMAEIKQSHVARKYEEVVELATKGLQIDPNSRTLSAKMHLTRAKGYNNMAIKLKGASKADDTEAVAAYKNAWQRAMQDCSKAIYFGEESTSPYLLKSGALQGLERWDEAVLELEACINNGPGAQDQSVHQKLENAKFEVKKASREDLYELLGVEYKSKASEKEIQKAYKKCALRLHPDKQGGKTEEEKEKAVEEFKRCGDALEVLTDPYMKQLWDEGHDLESIKQKAEMRKQRGGGHGHGGFPGGFGGF